eukprot:TRINITY_DN109718_c0_g1_i1.p1 TRINITY_DN109718_c0_g1~~TRINITY_DN109718_c0_g1_i1.p1  ORF type:complete len:443 (+),score=87.47 TRINITY_DN109718_c0_g1_i1:73-1401(+)
MPVQKMQLAVGISVLSFQAAAIDNGLGITPPMGWRSWNLYGPNVNQKLMQDIMDGIAERKRLVDGKPTSLCDLGYCDVGLDDNWQDCGKGTDGFTYHSTEGGKMHPLVNKERFPDMAAMTAHAHKLGLTAGWYGNNCICTEKKQVPREGYEGDVKALVDFGFDGVKLDGCGTQLDLDLWSGLINASGRPVTIENCHWGNTVPTKDWCPWNFFRTSGDIMASYGSAVSNLQTTILWAQKGLSRPGCWGYPDMLEVGCKPGSEPGLNEAETRSHFGAWCIVSAPLTLSMDVRNDTVMDRVWPLISNKEAIAINQAWAGHSGSPFKQSEELIEVYAQDNIKRLISWGQKPGPSQVPVFQYFYKPLDKQRVAVLLMNHGSSKATMTFDFKEVPGLSCEKCLVRDVWSKSDIGTVEKTFFTDVETHDAAFLVLSAATADDLSSPISV